MKKTKVWTIIIVITIFITSISFLEIKIVKANSTEKELLSTLPIDEKNIIKTYYDDFDNNGNYEIFVLEKSEEKTNSYNLWYANNNYVEKIVDMAVGDYYIGKVYEIGDGTKIFTILFDLIWGIRNTMCYYVINDNVYETIGYERLEQISGKDFAMYPSAFDAYQDKEERFSGHTYKKYYLYWTGNKFKEYQGKTISREQFESYGNADAIVNEIEDLGYKVNDIILRTNNIININCEKTDVYGGCHYENVTVQLQNNGVKLQVHNDGKTIIEKSSFGGIYEERCYEQVKNQKSIAVFTTEKSMKIKTGKSMWIGFGLLDENSGLTDDKWKKMSLVVSDPTIITLSDYTETEYGYSLEVIGKKQGVTNITITDTESGINTIITIFVQDDYAKTYSYVIDNIASFYPNNEFEENIETNIYDLNGLYVNKYKCTKSKDFYNVSFDVYNSKYYSGAIDIYDENGMWLGYEEIDKYSDISSLSDTLEQAYFLVSDTVTGKMLTYKQASFSKYTHIDIKIPKNGYFTISNNVSESPGTFFINALEILFDGASTALDLFTSSSIEDSALTEFKKEAKKTFATRLIEARNEVLKDNIKKNSQKAMLDSLKSEMKKTIEKFTKKGLKDKLQSIDDEYSEIANLAENMLNLLWKSNGINDITWKDLFESATGIGESYFTTFAGPAGLALKGCFALNDSGNKILMATQMAQSIEKPYVMIFSSIDTGYINPYGIIVTTNGNVDKKSILQVFRVSNSDVIEILLNSDNPFENYELYNICFVKDDKLVQPNGKVTVQIPVPKGMKSDTCKIYRQESNGAWKIINAKVQGNYLVFETEHFSLYAVIGENDNLVISSMPKKISYEDGEILNTYGLVLDLNGQLITDGYICEPTVLSGNGKQFVKVIYGHSVTEFEVNVEKKTSINTPQIKPTPVTTVTPIVATSSGLAISGGGISIVYTSAPIVTPTIISTSVPSITSTPVATPILVQTAVPFATSEPTTIPTITPEVSAEPSVMPSPAASSDTKTDNKTGYEKSIKKGLKFTDKKTKALYKIISTGKNKSVQYVKSTKKNITNATISVSVQFEGKTFKVVSIGKNAFKNNKKLQSVKIGKNVKTIGKAAFSGCKNLSNIEMGKNITSIKDNTCNKCTSLKKITIPAKVTKIGKKAFYKCKKLQYILVKTKKLKVNNIGENAFGSGYVKPRVKSDKNVWKLYQDIFISKGLSEKALFIINPAKLIV